MFSLLFRHTKLIRFAIITLADVSRRQRYADYCYEVTPPLLIVFAIADSFAATAYAATLVMSLTFDFS